MSEDDPQPETAGVRRGGKATAALSLADTAFGFIVPQTESVANGAVKATMATVARFGRDGNGNPIAILRGAPRNSATLARIGLGTKANGGFGMDGGNLALKVVAGVAVVGLLTTAAIVKSRTEADKS